MKEVKQKLNFSKILSKVIKIYILNIASFYCRGRQALPPDVRIIILLLIMKD